MRTNVPNEVVPYTDRISELEREGRYDEAVEVCRVALERFPDIAVLHNNLGCQLGNLELYEDAAAAFRRAVELTAHNRAARIVTPSSYPGEPEKNLRAIRAHLSGSREVLPARSRGQVKGVLPRVSGGEPPPRRSAELFGVEDLDRLWRRARAEPLPDVPARAAVWPPAHLPELPPTLESFVKAWWPWSRGTPFREVGADDSLWDSVPLVLESGRRRGSGPAVEIEGVLEFIGFWRTSGELALPAVTAQVIRGSDAVPHDRGQSVRDAYLRKGGDFVTRLTLAGFFPHIELYNLVSGPSSRIVRPGERSEPPYAWLETFTVRQGPEPVTTWQRFRALF